MKRAFYSWCKTLFLLMISSLLQDHCGTLSRIISTLAYLLIRLGIWLDIVLNQNWKSPWNVCRLYRKGIKDSPLCWQSLNVFLWHPPLHLLGGGGVSHCKICRVFPHFQSIWRGILPSIGFDLFPQQTVLEGKSAAPKASRQKSPWQSLSFIQWCSTCY